MSDVLQSPSCLPAVGDARARATDRDREAPALRRWAPLRLRRARGRFRHAASASAALEVHGAHTTTEVARLRGFSRATAQMR